MTKSSGRGDHLLLGSERDQVVSPEDDGVILEKVQTRVVELSCSLELSQGGNVLAPSFSSRESGSMAFELETDGQGTRYKRGELSLTILTCSMEHPLGGDL